MKMKRCAKRIVALLAVALMVVSMFGVTAFAVEEGSPTPDPTPVEEPIAQYTLTVNAAEGGSVTGGGTYDAGTVVTMTATANYGYQFTEWVGSDGSEYYGNPQPFKITQDITYTANFDKLPTASVTIKPSSNEAGTVAIDDTHSAIPIGTTVTVTASPAEGYSFVNWTDATGTVVSKDTAYPFSVEGDTVLTANFELAKVNVAVNWDENMGTVKGAGSYDKGDAVTLTAKATDGNVFTGWLNTVTNKVDSTDATYKFTANEDVSYTAQFEKGYTLTYVVTGDSTYGTPGDAKTPTAVTDKKNATVTLTTPTTSWKYSKGVSTGVKGTWKFSGWYSDKAMTKTAGKKYTLTEDVTLYGKWTFTPSSSSSSSSSKTSTTSPKTGETSPILPLMCVAIAACGAAVLVSRKKIAQ